MERKGGCCPAPRYGDAAAAQQQQQEAGAAWQMGKIMIKFRPIAPKPMAMAPVPAPTPVARPSVGAGSGKRKAVCGTGGGRRGRKPKKPGDTAAVVTVAPALDARECKKDYDKDKSSWWSSSSSEMTSVDSSPPPGPHPQQHRLATLTLMPVTPVEDKAAAVGAVPEEPAAPVPSQVAAPAAGARSSAQAMRPGPAAAAALLVTVEDVTATWRDGEATPSSALCAGFVADDDAPAFVSDQWGRVRLRNAAFARAVSTDDGDVAEAAPVVLGGALPAWGTCAGFTCRVRVRHSSRRRVGSSVVAPCDVWRMDAGDSYLWRLDLQAALTLGGRLSQQV